MTFLIQQTLLYAVPLMIVALAGVFAERSGIINLALEGIMVFGAFIGVLFVRSMQSVEVFAAAARTGNYMALQGLELLGMLIAALMGAVFSLLLSFASINLKADQTIGGTALNLMAPALVLFLIRIICNQNNIQMVTGDAASWFMLKKSTFGIPKNQDIGFLGETFLNKVYLATYVCILIFVILAVILYKTRFGLRLRACGENPQAADSLGINVYKMRYAGTTISGALAGMGGFVYALTTTNCTANGDVAGFGFLALAVMIFGNWTPLNIAGASLLFGLFKCIAAAYSSLDLNGDGVISYVMFKGQEGNMEADARTQYGVEDADAVLTGAGKAQLSFYDANNTSKYLVDQNGAWSAAQGQDYMQTILAQYSEANSNMVELVIANNDDMALGAIAALQAAGYNNGTGKTIPVFGVDATDAAKEKIADGSMTGTIKQDAEGMANAISTITQNLASGKATFEGIDSANVVGTWRVNIPYSSYTGE